MHIKKTPVFILGNGRSGTTMIGQLLSAAKLGVSFEGHFVVKAFKEFGTYINNQSELGQLIRLIEGFESSKAFELKLNRSDYNLDSPLLTKTVVNDALEQIAGEHSEKRWIEKTPHYINDLDLILKVFPDAKIIWMLRDGRDVAFSVFKKSWGANNCYYAAKDWVFSNYEKDALTDKRVLRVQYEKLLSNPIEGLAKIFSFLNYPYESIEELAQRINPTKMNQWKAAMSKQQVKTFESVAFDCLKKYGYETMYSEKPSLKWYERVLYIAHHNLLWGMHLVKINLIKPILIKLNLAAPFDEKN
jgi:hypothetical protein